MPTYPRVPCPKCNRSVEAVGELSIDGGQPIAVYQCDECLVTRTVFGKPDELPLTFCVDAAGRAFDPADPDEPLFPKS